VTLLCVPIMVRDTESALEDAGAARDTGAGLVEFRIDDVFHGTGEEREIREIVRLVSESPLPCIVTCRPVWEGGHYDGDEGARVSLYERLGTAFGPGEHPPRYIDVELAAYTRSANVKQKVNLAVAHPEQVRDLRTSLILSLHDFKGRPADLTRKVLAMRAEPAAKVHKVAFRARSLRDNLELFDLLTEADRPTIALGMGEFGLMSRVLAPKFGGFLTYASLRARAATAPGQPTVRELIDLYRFESIGPATRVYGVVGWPVGHSVSPRVHNAGFEEIGHDGVYLPLPVAPGYESLKATLLELTSHPRLGFAGCSVTIPHKEDLVRLAREQGWAIDADAAAIGAGNTLAVDSGQRTGGSPARVRVLNTDAPGARDCLREAIGDLAGKRVGVFGAGGVARAVAHACAASGAEVLVFNRTAERGECLASDLAGAGRIVPMSAEALEPTACDAYVNCTPVGMKGGPAGNPAERVQPASKEAVFFDTVYNPLETPMLKAAREAGFRTIDGLAMFVRQAAPQFEAWTGRPAPVAVFDRVARQTLREAGT